MSVYGTETDCTDKMLPGRLVSGPLAVAQAVYRRWTTTRGMLLEDPNYGRNVKDYLSMELTLATAQRIPGELKSEAMKDDRIDSCDVDSNISGRGAALTVDLGFDFHCADGPFSLSVLLTPTTAEIIIGSKAAA